jgi:rhodanese-related sulfurtransferase
MNEALPIGYFQFDNLIKNRVPFYLVRTDVGVEAAYGVIERLHVQNYSLVLQALNFADAQVALNERQARKEDPVVVLCDDGKESQKVANELTAQGYLNVYFVLGGWQMLQAEMKAER